MCQFFLEFITQLTGAAVGVLAGYFYIEKRTQAQQKPKQTLIERHKKNIEQFMLFYLRPREKRPAATNDFEIFTKNLNEADKIIIRNFFCHVQIAESTNDVEILFDVEYLKNNIHQDKFPSINSVLINFYQLLMAGCFDEEILEVLKGEPRKNINFFEPITNDEIDRMFDENK